MLSIVVTSSDVLSGRDKQAFGHEGNNYFRDLVQINREAYQGSRRRADKNAITKKVIGLIQDNNGRFLKQGKDNQWAVMSDEMIYEKVSHALRGAKSPTSRTSSGGSSAVSSSSASAGSRRSAAPSKIAMNQLGKVMGLQRAIFERLVRDGRHAAAAHDAVNVVSDSSLCGDDDASSAQEAAEAAWQLLPVQPQGLLLEDDTHNYIPDDIEYGSLSDEIPDPAEFQLLSSESLAFDIPSIGV
jgi:hypothetical protein